MRRSTLPVERTAALAALLLALTSACGGQPTGPSDPMARIFRVVEADGQLLPAHRPCPAPVEGMVTGAHFVEGELVLYPERTFTWRYTIQQYASLDGAQQAWVEPTTLQGTYSLVGKALQLTAGSVVRAGRITDGGVELAETLPCHYSVEGHPDHEATLELDEVDTGLLQPDS